MRDTTEEEGAVPVALAAQAGTGCGWQQTLVLDDCFGAELILGREACGLNTRILMGVYQ